MLFLTLREIKLKMEIVVGLSADGDTTPGLQTENGLQCELHQ
jgi:hypothetical protein